MIYTDENKFRANGRRNAAFKSYAAFHNDPTGTWPPNIQRKFMGDSPLVELKAQLILYNLLKSII